MLSDLFQIYQNLKTEHLLHRPFPLVSNNGSAPEVELVWEKTIEALYMRGVAENAEFAAPLVHPREDYGDLLIAYSTIKWALIEFKKDAGDRHRERDKYICTRPTKYENNPNKAPLQVEHEIAMFKAFVDRIGPPEQTSVNGETCKKREPHFFVFRPKPSITIRKFSDLRASFYWGAWAIKDQSWAEGKQLDDVEVSPAHIPFISAEYEQFAEYAACVKLAKSGEFTLSPASDGDGMQLVDLSLVIGLLGERIGHVSTLEAFLATHKLMLDNTHALNPAPRSSMKP